MNQPRDDNGQYVSLATLFERERVEHTAEHKAESERLEHSITTALTAVAETARIHAAAHARDHTAHERIHEVEKDQLDKAERMMNKRLEGMNEFRQALSDQAHRSVSRELFDATVGPLQEFRSRALGFGALLALLSGIAGALIGRTL